MINVISKDELTGRQMSVNALHANDNKFSPGIMRPWLDKNGETYIAVHDAKTGKMKSMQANTTGTLRKDQWKQLDEAIVMAGRERFVGVQSLESRGLVKNLANAMGTTVLEWDEMKDYMSAEVSMDALTRGQNDRPQFERKAIPIPIIHADFQINARALATENMLDTWGAEQAARKVAQMQEDMLFTDWTYGYGGGKIHSYLNHPGVNNQTLTKNWDDATKTGKNILDDVIACKQKMIEDKAFGPYELYIPTAYETKLDLDFSDNKGTNTIRQRILQIDGIDSIKVVDRLPENTVLMVNMQQSTIRLIKGLGLTNVQWPSEGGWVQNYKVVSIVLPQIRTDADGNCGIVKLAS